MKTIASKVKKSLLIVLLLTITAGMGISQSVADSEKKSKGTYKISGVSHHKHSNGISSFEVEHKGTIEISDDDREITAISTGGFIEISKTTFGSKRRVRIEGLSGGKLNKQYRVGREDVKFEPEGRKWLAEILPEVVRSTGIGAKSRVDRFYKKGGVQAVLNEIEEFDSDYVMAIYANLLLDKPGLKAGEIVTTLETISSEMSSDYYLANVLKDNSDKLITNDETATAYFRAVSEIGSDYYAAEVLRGALKNPNISDKSSKEVVNAAKNIGSDYYMSSVFMEVLDNRSASENMVIEILYATDDIGSDHYQSAVLKKVMKRDNLTAETQKALLSVVGEVSSDHYMATIFSEMLERQLNEEALSELLEVVANNMSSDHYAHVILKETINSQKLTDSSVNMLAEAVENMSSSHYATEIWKSLSDSEITENQLIVVLEAIADIDSDHYLSATLQSLAPKVRNGSSKLKDAYRSAAKRIDSETYYGRALRAID